VTALCRAARNTADAVRRREADDLVGELGARAIVAYYRHTLRQYLARARRARFEQAVSWCAGDELEHVSA
jgi:hypothetical protein